MAVTLHDDHITSPVAFGNMYLFLTISDVKKLWYLHDFTYRLKYSIFFDPCTITNHEAFNTLFTTPKN